MGKRNRKRGGHSTNNSNRITEEEEPIPIDEPTDDVSISDDGVAIVTEEEAKEAKEAKTMIESPRSVLNSPPPPLAVEEVVSTEPNTKESTPSEPKTGVTVSPKLVLPTLPQGSPDKEPGIAFNVKGARRTSGETFSFWLYRIVLSTKLPLYVGQPHFTSQPRECYFEVGGVVEVQCEKRYSDFEWLHRALREEYPSCPVPPIPAKHAAGTVDKVLGYLHDDTTSDNTMQPLVAERMLGIELFLKYLGGSPVFSSSEILRNFLLRDATELAEYREERAEIRARLDKQQSLNLGMGITGLTGWVKGFFGTSAHARVPNSVNKKKELAAVLQAQLSGLSKQWEAAIEREAAIRQAVEAMATKGALTHEVVNNVQDPPLSKLSAKIGARVIDDAGHRGVLRWSGTLENSPNPEMTYVGVEWDYGFGNSDGTIFDTKMFDCQEGKKCSFVLPEVLYSEPTEECNDILVAMAKTIKQVDIELSLEEAEHESEMLTMKSVFLFWVGAFDGICTAVQNIESLYGEASNYESLGAADGRSPELAKVISKIRAAEDSFNSEVDYLRQQWNAASHFIVSLYVRIFTQKPHQYNPPLFHWVDNIICNKIHPTPDLPT